jgi:hypothetical protein
VRLYLAEFVTPKSQGGLAEACTEETLMFILAWVFERNGFDNNRFGTTVEIENSLCPG